MKVTLIYTEADPWALGMRAISAALRQAGHETHMVFLRDEGTTYSEEVLQGIRECVADAEMIGVTCLARGSEKAKQVIQAVRGTGAFIVWGGTHATLFPEDCVAWADVVCRGEGEGFIVELVGRLERKEDWRTLANAAYNHDGHTVINPLRPLVQDLDSLPLPDYAEDRELHWRENRFVRPSEVFDVREPIMFNGSRGCAFHCTYCINAKLRKLFEGTGRYVRHLSMPKYVECVRQLKAHFPKARYAYLIDEDFFARKPDELEYFAREFPAQVGLQYECMGSPALCRAEKMDLLVKAGLWRVRLGLESGSERTKREVYDRPMTNESLRKAAEIINRYQGVTLCYFFMIANPYEEADDLLETARFLASLPQPYYSQVYNLVFFPGTALYDRALRDGLLSGKADSGFELDYRSGLKYQEHQWKRKNLYLNSLLFLMEGKSSRLRLGMIPRMLLPWLLRPSVVRINDKLPLVAEWLISLKIATLSLRSWVSRVLQRLLGDPKAVYDLPGYLRRALFGGRA
jgi:anaerobic magnesium-protoporphyrin IX monomethyl ester cyclase